MIWVMAFALFMIVCAVLAFFGVIGLLWRKMRRIQVEKHEKVMARRQETNNTALMGELLSKREEHFFRAGTCPDCGASLLIGPRGGMSVNYGCGNPNCGSRFNDMGAFGIERLTHASPILLEKFPTPEIGPYRTKH